MIDFTVTIELERPVGEVFAYVTDPSKLATWQTNTVSVVVEDGRPLRLGSRLREVHRAPGGKELPSLVEVSAYHPDSTFALHMLEGALPLDAHISFEPVRAGTALSFHVHGQPRGSMRLMQPLLKRTLRKQFGQYLRTLKELLEREPKRS
jgi:uncharacterized membrane protein